MPKDSKTTKQSTSVKGGVSKAPVVKLKSPKTAAAVAVVSNDIPVKELEERRRQMRTQLQQVEIQVSFLHIMHAHMAAWLHDSQVMKNETVSHIPVHISK